VATAIPNCPVFLLRAMIDQVMCHDLMGCHIAAHRGPYPLGGMAEAPYLPMVRGTSRNMA
jgi:hypothetical protein